MDGSNVLGSAWVPSFSNDQVAAATAPADRVLATGEVVVRERAPITPTGIEVTIVHPRALWCITLDDLPQLGEIGKLPRCCKRCGDGRAGHDK